MTVIHRHYGRTDDGRMDNLRWQYPVCSIGVSGGVVKVSDS